VASGRRARYARLPKKSEVALVEKQAEKHIVCKVNDLAPGEKKVVKLGSTTALLIRSAEDSFYAIRNSCPHQGADLSYGRLMGTVLPSQSHGEYPYGRDYEILRCPWHGFEFDVTTGYCLFGEKLRVKTYKVTVEGEDLVIHR
jgi:nitrite reductase/ring-hydroxylating ferredoxin subunit